MTVVIGALFVRETKDVDIHAWRRARTRRQRRVRASGITSNHPAPVSLHV